MTWYVLAAVVALILTGAVVSVIVVARRAVRRLRYGVAGRLVLVRSRFLPPGPRREAAALRIRLDAELRATRDMLEAAPDGVIFRADAAAVLTELAATATALDTELAAIERFLDPVQQRSALQTVTPQVVRVIDTTYTARQTILQTAVEDRNRRLESLQADVATQAAALDTYRRNGRELEL